MKKNELSEGLPAFVDHLLNCHACQYGKQKWRPFPKSTWRAPFKFHLVGRSEGWPSPLTPFVFAVGAWVNAL